MSDEISIEGKEYISSKRASEISGYAQDYIGQLARRGAIDAQRIGGLWYVLMASLEAYKKKSDDFVPEAPPKTEKAAEQDTIVSFDGRDYISAARASEITGYNADYVGQLARSGKILSRQVGNRWYVDRAALAGHKREKDALLAAVQAEAVGLKKAPEERIVFSERQYADAGPFLTYTTDTRDLMPVLAEKSSDSASEEGPEFAEEVSKVPIHIVRRDGIQITQNQSKTKPRRKSRRHGKTIFYGTFATAALTIVIVLSFEFTTLRQSSTYALTAIRDTASAAVSLTGTEGYVKAIGDWLEDLLVPEISYRRD